MASNDIIMQYNGQIIMCIMAFWAITDHYKHILRDAYYKAIRKFMT